MPNTPQGFPYPTPAEPVAGGAAAIEALARVADDRQKSIAAYAAAVATPPGGPWTIINVGSIRWQDWGGLGAGAPYHMINGAGRYRVTGAFQWTGQTGSGIGGLVRIDRYAAGGVLQESYYGNVGWLNSGDVLAPVVLCNAGDYFVFQVFSMAGSAGGAVYLNSCVEKLGPPATIISELESEQRPADEPDEEYPPHDPPMPPPVEPEPPWPWDEPG